MIALLLLAQVAAVETVATCRVPNDPQHRVFSLERAASSWRIALSSSALDKPRVELPLGHAQPEISSARITLSFASANGGRTVDWRMSNGPSSLDLHVNHGLEVNVERDLDPAVEHMNTDGRIDLVCSTTVLRSFSDGSTEDPGGTSEWIVAPGVARSVRLFQSSAGRAYAVQTIAYSRELTRELKFIGIRGRFAWGVEATPLFAQFSPSAIYGAGFAPVVWRWNFPPQRTWSAFAELAMGGIWTTEPIPEDTSRGNFAAHWGGGVRLRPRGRHAVLLAYRFQHLSNGNQLGSNPGVNSHVFLAGWSRSGSR